MYPQEWIEYLVHFHGSRDYFECHEILEEYWKEKNQQEPIWIGLIQIAVSYYHYRRGNLIGAKRMMETALINIQKHPVSTLDIDQVLLIQIMKESLSRSKNNMPYQDINIPIKSSTLLIKCKQRCEELNLEWCAPSSMNNLVIIHKHKMRDRTQVIQERINQLEKNQR